ncbi:hypothetical protein TRFO_00976 [Tritrichomonas foetus]|uniref:Signal sequence receptor subunit alpha n=1 Tax=Tritrichomonas foetus TaxID=1144522 RepID=A0A1J4L2J8_9EUKA|nr:hypothetical protein TRFO_00976 [Tritrichomonas foetus]|eukprot:OHT17675.1 hypothetical protein TRFO_00976 [Tritrichomonas foetus]
MFLYFILALAFAEEREGVSDLSGNFLPLTPKTQVDGRGLLPDYPDFRISMLRPFRFVSSFAVTGEESYGFVGVFGYATPVGDSGDYRSNITGYGAGGSLTKEDYPTFVHICQFEETLEPGPVNLELWGKLQNNQNQNESILLFNGTVEFYEETDVSRYIGTGFLYLFFVSVVGGIIYIIFSKDKIKESKPVSKKKKGPKDYSQIHDRSRSPSPGANKRSQSPQNRSSSPK